MPASTSSVEQVTISQSSALPHPRSSAGFHIISRTSYHISVLRTSTSPVFRRLPNHQSNKPPYPSPPHFHIPDLPPASTSSVEQAIISQSSALPHPRSSASFHIPGRPHNQTINRQPASAAPPHRCHTGHDQPISRAYYKYREGEKGQPTVQRTRRRAFCRTSSTSPKSPLNP